MSSNSFEKLHEEHREWMEYLTYWHNELVYYDRVLLRLLEGTKDDGDIAKMEEFKSRFDNMQDSLLQTRESISQHEQHLNSADQDGHAENHERVKSKMKEFKKSFSALKDDFYVFEEKFIYE